MKRSHTLATALAVAATAAVPMAAHADSAGSAAAAPPAKFRALSDMKVNGDTASFKARYRCNVGQGLWVSAKQMAGGRTSTVLRQEGSSQAAATWWDSHRNPITCDGEYHVQQFTIDTLEQPGKKGTLVRGKAWLQFCIVYGDETNGGLELSYSNWIAVR
jgi:hypothetical protein